MKKPPKEKPDKFVEAIRKAVRIPKKDVKPKKT